MENSNSISKFKTIGKIIKSKSGFSLCIIIDDKVIGFVSLSKLDKLIKDIEKEVTIGYLIKEV